MFIKIIRIGRVKGQLSVEASSWKMICFNFFLFSQIPTKINLKSIELK